MYLNANQGNHFVNLTDGNGNQIKNCVEIETKTGEAIVFVDLDRPSEWPEQWTFGEFLGWGGSMRVNARFKLPITVTTRSGVVVKDELQLAVAGRFEALGRKIDATAKRNKETIDDGFINLWAELGRIKAAIRKQLAR